MSTRAKHQPQAPECDQCQGRYINTLTCSRDPATCLQAFAGTPGQLLRSSRVALALTAAAEILHNPPLQNVDKLQQLQGLCTMGKHWL